MIYSFSGAPGQGKSEAISFFQEEGILTIPTERADKTKSITEFQTIQEETLEEKYIALAEFPEDMSLIMESSFVDMFIYSMMILGVHYDHSEWLTKFHNKCMEYQKIVDLTILFPFTTGESQAMNEFSAESFHVLAEYYLTLNSFNFLKTHGLDENVKTLIQNEEICT